MEAVSITMQAEPYSVAAVSIPALERWVGEAAAAAALGTLVLASVLIVYLLAFVIYETWSHVDRGAWHALRPLEGSGTTVAGGTEDLP